MMELENMITSAPFPQFHLNNSNEVRAGDADDLKKLVERIVRLHHDLPEDYRFEDLGQKHRHYDHYIQSGYCPNGRVEYFITTIETQKEKYNKLMQLLREYFGEPLTESIDMKHLDSIGIGIEYVKKSKDDSIEYAGLGMPWESHQRKCAHIIFGHIPANIKQISNQNI